MYEIILTSYLVTYGRYIHIQWSRIVYSNEKMNAKRNHIIVSMIPKNGHCTSINHYRPIREVTYKIMTIFLVKIKNYNGFAMIKPHHLCEVAQYL